MSFFLRGVKIRKVHFWAFFLEFINWAVPLFRANITYPRRLTWKNTPIRNVFDQQLMKPSIDLQLILQNRPHVTLFGRHKRSLNLPPTLRVIIGRICSLATRDFFRLRTAQFSTSIFHFLECHLQSSIFMFLRKYAQFHACATNFAKKSSRTFQFPRFGRKDFRKKDKHFANQKTNRFF